MPNTAWADRLRVCVHTHTLIDHPDTSSNDFVGACAVKPMLNSRCCTNAAICKQNKCASGFLPLQTEQVRCVIVTNPWSQTTTSPSLKHCQRNLSLIHKWYVSLICMLVLCWLCANEQDFIYASKVRNFPNVRHLGQAEGLHLWTWTWRIMLRSITYFVIFRLKDSQLVRGKEAAASRKLRRPAWVDLPYGNSIFCIHIYRLASIKF